MQIEIRKGQLPILIFNLCVLAGFSVPFAVQRNYEFIIYIGVVIFFVCVFIYSNSKVYYPNTLLWCLSIWALMHLSGGTFTVGEETLYGLILIPICEKYPIFRYDQLVHIFGFGTATVALFYVLKPLLRSDLKSWTALSVITIAAGLGVGALNEIIEFFVPALIPGVGFDGYINTALDLVADLIGALIALVIIRITNRTDFS